MCLGVGGKLGLFGGSRERSASFGGLLLACLYEAESHFLACLISSLKKMTVGMFLASMAFVVAAIVQVEIDVSFTLILQWPFLVAQVGCSEVFFLQDQED